MIGILVIAHEPLASALVHCTRHVFQRLPSQLAALDVVPDEDPDLAHQAAMALGARINDGSGLLVFTDVYGATPSRIAERLAKRSSVTVFSGVNLPLLLKSLGHRRGVSLDELVQTLVAAGAEGLGPVTPGSGDETTEESPKEAPDGAATGPGRGRTMVSAGR